MLLFASNMLWSALKQVATYSYVSVFWSYVATCRPLRAIGEYAANLLALEVQKAGCFWTSRRRTAIQRRPFWSTAELRTSAARFQTFSPQNGEAVGAALNDEVSGGAWVGTLMFRTRCSTGSSIVSESTISATP